MGSAQKSYIRALGVSSVNKVLQNRAETAAADSKVSGGAADFEALLVTHVEAAKLDDFSESDRVGQENAHLLLSAAKIAAFFPSFFSPPAYSRR